MRKQQENPFKPLPNKRYTIDTLSQHCKISGELCLNPFTDMANDALRTLLSAQSGAGKSFSVCASTTLKDIKMRMEG